VNRQFNFSLPLAYALLAVPCGFATADTNAPAGFQLKHGFRLELVAAEPLVFDPVALAFDGDGRLFVAEDRDFPGPGTDLPRTGRVRLLEDTDGDGRFDASRDFAEDLPSPSALICWDSGVIVATGAQILHLMDTNGDGRADERKVLFAGPTNTAALADAPLPVRSFVWGLDNRVHAAAGGLPASLAVDPPNTLLPGHDFAFDSRSDAVEVESSFGSTGLSFDSRGRKFACAETHPLRQVMWAARHAAQTNGFVMPSPMADLCGPASATPIFPLRTVALPSSLATPRAEVRPTTEFFTAASSVLVYRGNVFPPAYHEDVFVADARANLIHRFKLRADGLQAFAERPADDRGSEFLATTNTWFRPMQLAAGPEGAIYVVDLHREFVDAPARLPEAQADAAARRRGNDRGRIYRIVPDNFKPPAPPRLEKAKTLDLLMNLAHLNGWHRDTAARLLCERQDRTAVPLLSNMVKVAKSPLARLHALGVLDGLGALQESHVLPGLKDADDRVRQHAVRLAGKMTRDGASLSDALWSALRPLAADATVHVRYEWALALRAATHAQSDLALLEILRRDLGSSWTRAAVLNALASGVGDSFRLLLNDARVRNTPAGREFLRELAALVGTRNDPREVGQVLAAVDTLEDAELGFAMLHHLDEGLRRVGSGLTSADPDNTLRIAYQRAMTVADDSGLGDASRAEATRLLAAVPFDEVSELLFALISPVEREGIQLAAVETLARIRDARVGAGLVQRWGGMSGRVRAATLEALLAHPENTRALLDAVQDGRVRRDDLSPAQILFLRSHPDGALAQRAGGLFAAPASGDRAEAVKRLLPALQLRGQATRGRQVFLSRCAECHRFRGEGHGLGPDLETTTGLGKEWMLRRFVNPNGIIAPRALIRVVKTRHLGSLLGTIENETPAGISLRRLDGELLALPRSALGTVTSLGISAMPEGLETGLAPQSVADLLEYLAGTPR
jgi:putative membrane-bound dehydrogenase-like protein